MNSAKRSVSSAVVRVVLVLVVGLVFGGMGTALAGDKDKEAQDVMVVNTTSEPVPVLPQGTTNVSGSVEVSNWPSDTALPVAQQGSVEVYGTVGIDASANTVQIDSTIPVAVAPQGTTNVSGSVEVSNWPTDTDPLPVAQQGPVDVQGSVQVYGMVGIDPTANTVQIDSAAPVAVSGSVSVSNSTSSPVPVAPQGTTNVAGSVDVSNWPTAIDPLPVAQQGPVGIDSTANTVKIDSTAPVAVSGKVEIDSTTPVAVSSQGTTNVAGSVSVSNSTSNPVPVAPQGTTNVAGSVSVNNSTSSPVPVAQQGNVSVQGTVGLSTTANTVKLDTGTNTVKLDATYNTVRINSSANLVKVDADYSTLKVTNPTGQALDVRVVEGGGGGSAPQPVQFTSTYADSYSWTNAYTVPAGKILKIENVSVYAESETMFPVVSMRTTAGGVTSEHWLPALEPEWMPLSGGTKPFTGKAAWRLCTQVAIYADENTVVQSVARCNNFQPAGCGSTAGFNVTFSGYLTDK